MLERAGGDFGTDMEYRDYKTNTWRLNHQTANLQILSDACAFLPAAFH